VDVFGKGSREYLTRGSDSVGYPEGVGGYNVDDREYQRRFIRGLPKMVTTLEGLIKRLEEKREDLGSDSTARARATFEGLDLHLRIRDVAAELFRDGHYRNAVGDAAVALVNMVKEKSRRHDLDGHGLMTTVFSKNNPILMFNELAGETDENEQQGMMYLFMGAVLALRNPRAHNLSFDSAEEARDYLVFVSMLARKVDQAKRRPTA
jgi:uncharacterized protein (TIGR02391 family)